MRTRHIGHRFAAVPIGLCLAAITSTACGTETELVAPRDPPISAASQADTEKQINLTFEKSASVTEPFVWEGSVDGDVAGPLRTELQLEDFRETGRIWHVRFLWIIDDGGSDSFVADLTGILNLNTGRVVMNGRVVSAADPALVGAQVHEEGQLVDPATSTFQGTITVNIPTAG